MADIVVAPLPQGVDVDGKAGGTVQAAADLALTVPAGATTPNFDTTFSVRPAIFRRMITAIRQIGIAAEMISVPRHSPSFACSRRMIASRPIR